MSELDQTDAMLHPELPEQALSEQALERRASNMDRRAAQRQGKFDRRRNRCVKCRFFTMRATGQEPDGYCQQHQTVMASDAFTCRLFEASSTTSLS